MIPTKKSSEIIVGKGENACNQFLIFSQSFQPYNKQKS